MGSTDLETIRSAFLPLAVGAPLLIRGAAQKWIKNLTHQTVKDLYVGAGGEPGIQALTAAIIRIGKGETIGVP